jgi:hypothetical protein
MLSPEIPSLHEITPKEISRKRCCFVTVGIWGYMDMRVFLDTSGPHPVKQNSFMDPPNFDS